jgi:hypothetical protein
MTEPRSYLVNGALAAGVLYYAQRLSSSGRTAVDWIVIGLCALAVLWNLFKLGRRLHRAGGGRDLWHLLRTLGFWIVGLLNTLLIRPEDVGSWKNFVGWAFLALALLDSVALFRKEKAAVASRVDPPSS